LKECLGDAGPLFIDLNRRVAETLIRLRQARDVSVGCSRKRAVWSQDKTTLYRYLPLPLAPSARTRPVLICFALVNRPYVLDLQPDRSLVRRLLAAGLDVYLIDWGNPDDADRLVDLDDYIERYLGGCVRHVLDSHGIDALNLLGACQGGTFSLCYTALHPQHIANLVTITTPVDFHTPDNLLSKWVRELDMDLILRTGNVSGELLNALFLSMMPFRLMHQKYIRLLGSCADQRAVEDFVRMERWIFDSPDQAAAAVTQFVKWFYQENRLIRGTLELAGRRVNLKRILQPVLNIYATQDHIVPSSSSAVMRQYLGSQDYTVHTVDTGHIGIYVSRLAQESIPPRLISWLQERE
jgi:polyhydroxyalkanoate synthase subunit PhaC